MNLATKYCKARAGERGERGEEIMLIMLVIATTGMMAALLQ